MKNTEARVKIEGILPGLHTGDKVYAYILTPYLNLLTKYAVPMCNYERY